MCEVGRQLCSRVGYWGTGGAQCNLRSLHTAWVRECAQPDRLAMTEGTLTSPSAPHAPLTAPAACIADQGSQLQQAGSPNPCPATQPLRDQPALAAQLLTQSPSTAASSGTPPTGSHSRLLAGHGFARPTGRPAACGAATSIPQRPSSSGSSRAGPSRAAGSGSPVGAAATAARHRQPRRRGLDQLPRQRAARGLPAAAGGAAVRPARGPQAAAATALLRVVGEQRRREWRQRRQQGGQQRRRHGHQQQRQQRRRAASGAAAAASPQVQ